MGPSRALERLNVSRRLAVQFEVAGSAKPANNQRLAVVIVMLLRVV